MYIQSAQNFLLQRSVARGTIRVRLSYVIYESLDIQR